VDLTVSVDHLPKPGETVLGRDFYQSVGGKGANQAVAAKKAGADVFFLTKLGNDANGKLAYRWLMAQGLPKAGLLSDPRTPTGVAVIVVDQQGNNQIAVAPGSNSAFAIKQEIRPASRLIAGGTIVLVQLELPLPVVTEVLALAKENKVKTILNPAPAVPLSSDVLTLVDILTPNEQEAQVLAGQKDVEEAARILVAKGARTVIVTLGARGALVADSGPLRHTPPFTVQAVDSTGAGDAFNGALACALAEREPMTKAVVFASAAGALTTTKRGAQDSLPTRAEIETFLCSQRHKH
jgi:ribokinase